MPTFRQTFLIVLATLLAIGLVERVTHTALWAGDVNRRADAGLASFRFLAAPALGADGKPVKDAKGKPVTNADVLGVLIQERLRPAGK